MASFLATCILAMRETDVNSFSGSDYDYCSFIMEVSASQMFFLLSAKVGPKIG